MTKPKWMFWEKHFINPSTCLLNPPKGTLFWDESEKKQKLNFSHIQQRSLLEMSSKDLIGIDIDQMNSKSGVKIQYRYRGAIFSFSSFWNQIVIRCKMGPLKVFKVSVMGTLCSDYSHIFSKKCILGGFVRRFKEHWLFHRGLFEQSLMWCNLALKQNTTTLEKSKSSQFGLKIILFS